ncbi:MAG: hypothetical protein Q8R53_05360 [Nanoarchaeota archaeon]|nr:hypothetical protein [Nanoarchaeota archaeon]
MILEKNPSAFTAEEKLVLQKLVEKELRAIKSEGKKAVVANSPAFGKLERSDDLAFLKSEKLAQQFLERLSRKLKEQ